MASRTLSASLTRERISPTRRISKNGKGQPQEVAGVAGDQRQVHLAADVRHQVLAEQAEEGPEQDDQHHADAQGVEQPPLVADEHGVDQVLDEVGGGDPQHGHEQGADEGLDQDGGVGGQQAEEPPPGADGGVPPDRRAAAPCPGPPAAGCRSRRRQNSSRDRVSIPRAGSARTTEPFRTRWRTTKCPLPSRRGRGRRPAGAPGQGLVRAPDALGREAEPLGGLHQGQEVRADAVGAGQVAKLAAGRRAGGSAARWSPAPRPRSRSRRPGGQ